MQGSVCSSRLMLAACGAFALASCETVDETVNEVVGNNFSATLSGASEVPPADPDGWGRARITINDSANTICTDLEVRDIGDVTAAHSGNHPPPSPLNHQRKDAPALPAAAPAPTGGGKCL